MSIPLYHQIANTLAREISQSRSAAPQDAHALLPSELVLCERFQVSRHTIRAALAQLVNEGLVTRKKRSGTRVNAHSGVGAFRENLASLDDLEVLKNRRIQLTGLQAQEMDLPSHSSWLELHTRRIDSRAPLRPICISQVWIDAQYADLLSAIKTESTILISDLIEQSYGRRVAYIDQQISAMLLDEPTARALNAPAGSAALKVVRHYFDRTKIAFEVASSIHPADRFDLHMRLERAQT
jgi:GntR family transcriptional regulator